MLIYSIHLYSRTFSMSPAPRFAIAAFFLSGRSGVNFNLSDFNRDKGTVTIICEKKTVITTVTLVTVLPSKVISLNYSSHKLYYTLFLNTYLSARYPMKYAFFWCLNAHHVLWDFFCIIFNINLTLYICYTTMMPC